MRRDVVGGVPGKLLLAPDDAGQINELAVEASAGSGEAKVLVAPLVLSLPATQA